MIGNKKVLAMIPARGGSKGLPGKNIKNFCDKPLIAWTIEAAKSSSFIDRVTLSSDDEKIMDIATQWGCNVPFKRPPNLANDTTPMEQVARHTINEQTDIFDYLVILQPTSPLRTATDIDDSIRLMHQSKAPSCVSATPATKPPHWMFTLDEKDKIDPILNYPKELQRQGLLETYVYNGAVYVLNIALFLESGNIVSSESRVFIMPADRSVDIDTELDFDLAQILMSKEIR